MSGNQRRAQLWQFAFDNMQVRAADSTSANPQQDLPGTGLRARDVHNLQWLVANVSGSLQDGGFHN
jgi:hypothetical protein